MQKYLMARCKVENGTTEKGLEVHDTMESATGAFHAYMGAYGYNRRAGATYVGCCVMDTNMNRLLWDVWEKKEPDPEPEQEGE